MRAAWKGWKKEDWNTYEVFVARYLEVRQRFRLTRVKNNKDRQKDRDAKENGKEEDRKRKKRGKEERQKEKDR